MLTQAYPITVLADVFPHEFVSMDFVEPAARLANIAVLESLTIQDLFHLMQQDAETDGLLPLQNAELDELVPLLTVRKFLARFLRGYREMAAETTPRGAR